VTLWDRLACANAIGGLRREGLFTPPSLQGTLVYPFTGGGANWGSAAYDPSRNLLIVNMNNMAHEVRLYPKTHDDEETTEVAEDVETAPMEGGPYSMSRRALLSPLGLPCTPPPWGVLAGVDLSTGQIVWRRAFGTTEDLAPGRLAMPLGVPGFGGPIVTAGGLIFIGAAMDDYLRAFDVETGAELWKGRLPAGGQATPMTYVWEGRQYVVIAAGGHARAGTRLGDSVVAFALPRPSSP
jgi:quinoprotein glucose dehydrogenase